MKLFQDLEKEIQDAYTGDGKTAEEAEKLAAKFLHAQMQISASLKVADLDARMRKAGIKTVRGTIYLDEVSKAEKKPSDVLLEQVLNINELVISAQHDYDEAEVNKAELERWYDITREAHIYFRALSKGRFE
jgi:hypothetical protein